MVSGFKTIAVFALAVIIAAFVWLIFGRKPEVAAIIFGAASFITFGGLWLSLLKSVAASSTKQGERLVRFIGRLCIGSILFAAIVALMSGLTKVTFEPLYSQIAAGNIKDLLDPAGYSHQVMVVILSAIIAYGLVSPVVRWPAMILIGIVCVSCLLVPALMVKSPWFNQVAKDASVVSKDAIETATEKLKSEAESVKASVTRDRLLQLAKDQKDKAIADAEASALLHEYMLIELEAKSPLVVTITDKGVISFSDQFEGNPEPVAKNTVFTLKATSGWLQNTDSGAYYVPFFRDDKSALVRFFKLNHVGKFIRQAIEDRKAAYKKPDEPKTTPSIPVTGIPTATIPSVSTAAISGQPNIVIGSKTGTKTLEFTVNNSDWTATGIFPVDGMLVKVTPVSGDANDLRKGVFFLDGRTEFTPFRPQSPTVNYCLIKWDTVGDPQIKFRELKIRSNVAETIKFRIEVLFDK